jgi:hypothetical protein
MGRRARWGDRLTDRESAEPWPFDSNPQVIEGRPSSFAVGMLGWPSVGLDREGCRARMVVVAFCPIRVRANVSAAG